MPTKEYPAFEAALPFLPALEPGEALSLLDGRVERLEGELAAAGALRELVEKARLPRPRWVEAEFAMALRAIESHKEQRGGGYRHTPVPALTRVARGDNVGTTW